MKKNLLHRYCEGVAAIPTANFLVICVEIIPYKEILLLICSYIILSTLSLQKLAFEILTLPTK